MTAVASPPAPPEELVRCKLAYEIQRRGRFWEVLDSTGVLVCMTVYKCGAKEVVRRLRSE